MARQRSGKRRRYRWVREFVTQTELAAGVTSQLISITDAELVALGMQSPTLVRIRGEIYVEVDSATAAVNETTTMGVGIIVVPSAITAAELGGPLTSPDQEWMYWVCRQLAVPGVITGGGGAQAAGGHTRWEVDVKAMRKLHKSTVFLAVENVGGAVVNVFASASLSFLFQE